MSSLSLFGTYAIHLLKIKKDQGALDIACGDGKYSICLAENGWKVSAVDINTINLKNNVKNKKIKIFEINLENEMEKYFCKPPFNKSYNLIIVYKYLYRPLLYKLPKILVKNGILIYETFMEGNEKYGRPRNPDYLLKKNELKKLSSDDLEIIEFKQGIENLNERKCVMQSAIFKKN